MARTQGEQHNSGHSHLFTIGDEEAVEVLMGKLEESGVRQQRREKLRQALEVASKQYKAATAKERKAFFHGMLTGYGVALKLW